MYWYSLWYKYVAAIYINTGSMVSGLTDPDYGNTTNTKKIEMSYDPRYVTKVLPNSVCIVGADLNFSVGRSADIATRLLHESDLREAYKANRQLAKHEKKQDRS